MSVWLFPAVRPPCCKGHYAELSGPLSYHYNSVALRKETTVCPAPKLDLMNHYVGQVTSSVYLNSRLYPTIAAYRISKNAAYRL